MIHLRATRTRRLPLLALALLAALALDAGAQTFSGQGLLLSARAGGRGVAVDGLGRACLLESAPAPDDPSVAGVYVSKIDPATRRVIYRKYIGHGDGLAIAADAAGNVYVTGKAYKNDFAVTRSYITPGSGLAAFVVKLDGAGTRVYSVLVGGGEAIGSSLAVDNEGSAFVAGVSHTDDFPTTASAYDRTFNGGGANDTPSDVVVFKVDGEGGLVYSTYLGGGDYEEAGGIAVDGLGNAYVTGWTFSTNFPTTPAAFQPAAGSDGDAFVTKLNYSGSGLLYSTYLGGFGRDFGQAIAVDGSGRAFVGGETLSTNFPTTPGAHRTSYHGNAFDLFVTALDEAGTQLGYSTYLGGGDNDTLKGIVVDGAGAASVVGDTVSSNFPVTQGAIQSTPQGSDDVFLTRLDAQGAISYSTRLAGTGPDTAAAVATDARGDIYVTGHAGTGFPISPEAPATVALSPVSPFFARLVPRAALRGSAAASSQEGQALLPAAALDGNPATRWSSAFSDPQWLTIDLGVRSRIDRVVLHWETAHATAYEVQVSEDGSSWSGLVATSAGDGGLDDHAEARGVGRYVRVYGWARATAWGYSLWEFLVFGAPMGTANTPPTVAIVSPADGAKLAAPASFDIRAEASDADGSVARVDFYVDGNLVVSDAAAPFLARYTAPAGSWAIRAEAFDDLGASASHSITITVVEAAPGPGENLALGKPAFSSSAENAMFGPRLAVDGSRTTRWSSVFSDTQWIYVDLGQRVSVATVVLRWETAYGAGFEIQVSDDATAWTSIYTTTSGTGGTQVLDNLSGAGRYVRMLGRKRATPWGYSLWELEVYGTPAQAPSNLAAGKRTVSSSNESASLAAAFATDGSTTTRWSSAFTDGQWIHVDLGTLHEITRIVLRWETAYAAHYQVQLSNDGAIWRTARDVFSGGGVDDLRDLESVARYVRVLALRRATAWGVSLWELEVYGAAAALGANQARGATATASSVEHSGLGPANAIDGSQATRWSSAFADGQWIRLDFGVATTIQRLVLKWETAYASQYVVEASTDGVTWRSALRVEAGDGGVDDLSVDTRERYLRIWCDRRATPWGSSLWEIEAYGPAGAAPAVMRWQILVLIYEGTDITYVDGTGSHRVIGRIDQPQLHDATVAATRFVNEDIPALTSGHMVPNLTIRYPGTLARLSPLGDGFWPSPWDVDRDPAFDAVIVIWQPNVVDQATGQALWIGTAAGLALAMGTGQTYMTLIADAATTYGHRNVFKHEFGHSITEYFDAAGTAPKPKVENHTEPGTYVHCGTGAAYVWVDETDAAPVPNSIYHNTSGFTHDYYSGTTALATAPNACLGVTAAAWAAGGPVTKAVR